VKRVILRMVKKLNQPCASTIVIMAKSRMQPMIMVASDRLKNRLTRGMACILSSACWLKPDQTLFSSGDAKVFNTRTKDGKSVRDRESPLPSGIAGEGIQLFQVTATDPEPVCRRCHRRYSL